MWSDLSGWDVIILVAAFVGCGMVMYLARGQR